MLAEGVGIFKTGLSHHLLPIGRSLSEVYAVVHSPWVILLRICSVHESHRAVRGVQILVVGVAPVIDTGNLGDQSVHAWNVIGQRGVDRKIHRAGLLVA